MKPERPIRRFDVFAEYRRQEEEARGMPADEAQGYGLWVAKVVAGRRFGGAKSREHGQDGQRRGHEAPAGRLVDGKWHALDGEPQTAALFDHEIVRRMGQEFYREAFAPAIRAAREQGKSYESIRDAIRREWKPD